MKIDLASRNEIDTKIFFCTCDFFFAQKKDAHRFASSDTI